MANSFILYTGNGSNQDFTVPFGYISQAHVTVEVAGVAVAASFTSGTVIRTTVAPANLAVVKVKRTTPKTTMVTFSDAAGLLAADLNLQGTQARYISEEQEDAYLANVLTDLSVNSGHLADGAVTTAKLGLASVTLAKMADLATRKVIGRLAGSTGVPEAVGFDDLTVVADGSTTQRDLSARFADVRNVRDYGAVGDGITDDTAAIQAAVTAAQPNAGKVLLPPGVYRTTATVVATSTVNICGEGKPGPRVYASATPYGGAEILFDPSATLSDNLAPGSFALSIDTGTIGAEGFAYVTVDGIGFSSTNIRGGGIYVEGAVGVTINRCRFTGGIDQYTAGTTQNVGVFARDMIISRIIDCAFMRMGFGILGDDYFNENTISGCDFEKTKTLPIGIWSTTNESIRNTIRDCNFLGDPVGLYSTECVIAAGKVTSLLIDGCTMEIIRKNCIQTQTTHPVTGVSLGASVPGSICVNSVAFIATGGAVAGSVGVSLCGGGGHYVKGCTLFNPSGPLGALIGTLSAVTGCYASGNDIGSKALVSGDPTKVVQDHRLWRSLPQDTSETDQGAWTSANPAAIWQNGSLIRCFQGTRLASLQQVGNRQDTTGAASPNVVGVSTLFVNPGGPYSITGFTGGQAGQRVLVYNQSVNAVTVVHGGNFLMGGSVNRVLTTAGHAVEMVCLDGATWVQMATRVP